MSDEQSRVFSHPAITSLDSISPLLNAAVGRAATDAGTDPALLGTIAAMVAYVREILRDADPSIVTDNLLTALHNSAGQVQSSITAYVNAGGAGHLHNAVAELEGSMSQVARIAVTASRQPNDRARAALAAYHDQVSGLTQLVRGHVQELEVRASALASSIQQLETRLSGLENRGEANLASQQTTFDTLQAQRQSTFDTSQAQRQETFEADFAKQRSQTATALEEWRQATDLALAAAGRRMNEKHAEVETLLETGLRMFANAVETTRADSKDSVDKIIAALEVRRGEADKLVGIIGERGVTSTYQRTADEARLEMILWQTLTVGVLGALLYATIQHFVPALEKGWNWGVGGARIMVSVVALLTASYTGAQAKIARDTVRKNRRREMDLSALGPYLADLPDDQRNLLRSKIADRYFVDEIVPDHPGRPLERLTDDPEIAAALKGIPKAVALELLKAGKVAVAAKV